MQIVERYLDAIEFWLPKKQRKDIIAEISEDIQSQVEERQEALGRALTEAELEELLADREEPVLVATRYLPPRYLIGPRLYPVYIFVLKVFAFLYLAPSAVAYIVASRLARPAVAWVPALKGSIGSTWIVGFTVAGAITIVFAVLQGFEARGRLWGKWNPRKLPPLRQPGHISRADSTFELAACLAALGWLVFRASAVDWRFGSSLRVTLDAAWWYFLAGFVAVTALQIALSAVNLLRPHWTAVRAACRLGLDAAGSALFCGLLKANLIATLQIASQTPAQSAAARDAIQGWLGRAFPFAALVSVIVLGVDVYRVARARRRGECP